MSNCEIWHFYFYSTTSSLLIEYVSSVSLYNLTLFFSSLPLVFVLFFSAERALSLKM